MKEVQVTNVLTYILSELNYLYHRATCQYITIPDTKCKLRMMYFDILERLDLVRGVCVP